MNIKLLAITLSVAMLLVSCKSKNEARGDEHLSEGRYMNAVRSYTAALQAGKMSDEFYDNFTMSYIKVLGQMVKKDATNEAIRGYTEQIEKNLPKVKDVKVVAEYVAVLIDAGNAQVAIQGEYEYTLQGFRNLDSAAAIAKRFDVPGSAHIEARKTAENTFVKKILADASLESNNVAREYILLTAQVVAPENAELKKALNDVRLKNRGDFLIFEAAGIEQPSRWVNTNGYVIAFPSLTMTANSLKAEVQFWGSTGNNTDLAIEKIKLVSTEGKEVLATQVGIGWCSSSDPEGKTKEKLNKVGKLLNEGQCSANITFSFSAGFVPDYVEYKDQYGIGRKYLGQ